MVTLVTGFPGSGKSFYAVDKIFNILNLTDKMSENIEVIYTNINGIKFDYFPDSKIQFKKFNDSEFYLYLAELYTLYELNKNDDSVDDKLIELSKQKGYHNALIVFDECHDFFSNQDKYKIFWLTYHRHLYHEIILLTQNKTLIHSKYRAIPEIFIEAQPRSKKIMNNSLSYKKYASFSMRKADYFGKDVLKARQEVFDLYQSGNKSNQKSILSKYLKLIVVFIIIVFSAFYYILNSFKSEEKVISKPKESTINKRISHSSGTKEMIQEPSRKKQNTFATSFLCTKFNGCIYKNKSYPYVYVRKFIDNTKSKIIHTDFIYKSKDRKNHVMYLYVNTTETDLKNYFIFDAINSNKRIKNTQTIPSFESITEKVSL